MTDKKTFTIHPSWKHFFWSYLLSILGIPLAGIGLITLYFTRKKHQRIRYVITNDRITSVDQKYEHNVDLIDIQNVEINKSTLQERLGIATLTLHTSASKMALAGISNPEELKNILEQAIKNEKERQEQQEQIQRREPAHDPGNMEKIEYLMGLWQQGLISEEDYRAEREQLE